MSSNGSKNGATQKDLLVTLVTDVRQLQTSMGAIQTSMETMRLSMISASENVAKMAGTLDALIEVTGRNEARLDDLDERVTRLESRK